MSDFQQQEDDLLDLFDHIPDAILLLILNKVFEAKSLCRCLVVSKRFASLIPQVDSIFLDVNPEKSIIPIEDSSILRSGSRSVSKNFIKSFFTKFIGKPLQFIVQAFAKKTGVTIDAGTIDFAVGIGLKSFSMITSLHLELPCHGGGDIGFRKAIPSLKWEAQFGKELERCLIIGSNSIVERKVKNEKLVLDEISENEQLFSDDELKLRVIWIISCLIASSARHNLLKKVVDDCPNLESIVVTDSGKQGTLYMKGEQIKELRESMRNNNNQSSKEDSTTRVVVESQMGYVGNLVMKLWYVKELDLPSFGKVMKGATMVEIRTENKVENEKVKEDGWNLKESFQSDDMFGEVVKELLKRKEKRMYRLEMNSF